MKSPTCLCRDLSLGGVPECVRKPAHLVIQVGGTDGPVGTRSMLTGLSLLWEGGGGKLFSKLIREPSCASEGTGSEKLTSCDRTRGTDVT